MSDLVSWNDECEEGGGVMFCIIIEWWCIQQMCISQKLVARSFAVFSSTQFFK
jgi:hypothetical protein